MGGTVGLSHTGSVAVVTISNPARLNAFDQPMAEAMASRLHEAATDGAVRAVLLRGAGDHFCAGGDLAAIRGAADPSEYVLKLAGTANAALRRMREVEKPVLAELKGAVAGGGVGLALAADLRIASDTTKISLAFARVGLSPDMGSTWTLPRMVGRGRAFELALAADPLPVMEAWRWGLVNRVVKAADLEAASLAWALELGRMAPRAVAEVKALFNSGEGASFLDHLEADSAAIARMAGTADFREGADSFLGKRPPEFKGR